MGNEEGFKEKMTGNYGNGGEVMADTEIRLTQMSTTSGLSGREKVRRLPKFG